MQITTNHVVTFAFVLKDEAGEQLDASETQPVLYLHGHSELVPGFERALEGKKVGDKLQARVLPIDGYGERDEERILVLDRSELPAELEPELGLELNAEDPDGEPISLWITAVDEKTVTVDGNHPLAGVILNFEAEVLEVRAASAEEIAHGHAHDPAAPHDAEHCGMS